MATVVLLDQNTNVSAASTSEYAAAGIGAADNVGATTETNQYATRRSPGVMSKLACTVLTNAATTSSTYISKINTVAGNMTMSIGAGATGNFIDNTNTDTISAGDEFDRAFNTGATGGITFLSSVAFSANTNTVASYITNEFNYTADTVVNYILIAGSTLTTTENDAEQLFKTAGTFKNAFALVKANDYTLASTVRLRKNGADVNIVLSITALTTGLFEDTSNSDTIAVDDVVNWSVVGSLAGSTLNIGALTVEFETTNNQYMITGGSGTGGGAVSADIYGNPSSSNANVTESLVQSPFTVSSKTSFLTFYVSVNTTSNAIVATLRKNSANATQTISITAATTGRFTDTTNTDTYTETDNLSIFFDHTGTGTANVIQRGILVETLTGTPTRMLMGVGT